MINIWNLQWDNHNQLRAYPLNSLSTRLSVAKTFKLPDDFIVGMKLSVSGLKQLNPAGFYISSVGSYGTGYTIQISYTEYTHMGSDDNTSALNDPVIATVTFQSSQLSAGYQMFKLEETNANYRTSGFICIGSLSDIQNQPSGLWQFNYSGGAIDPDVVLVAASKSPFIFIQNSNGVVQGPYDNIIFKAADDFVVESQTTNNVTTISIGVSNG